MEDSESKRFITELVRKHYPEKYVELYGVDSSIASELTHKRLKEEAKKLGVHHFNSMTFGELTKAIEAARAGNQEALSELTETAGKRFQGGAMKALKKAGEIKSGKDEIKKQAEKVRAAQREVEAAGKEKPKAAAHPKKEAAKKEAGISLPDLKAKANKLGIGCVNAMNKTMLLKAIEAKEKGDEKAVEALVKMAKEGKRL